MAVKSEGTRAEAVEHLRGGVSADNPALPSDQRTKFHPADLVEEIADPSKYVATKMLKPEAAAKIDGEGLPCYWWFLIPNYDQRSFSHYRLGFGPRFFTPPPETGKVPGISYFEPQEFGIKHELEVGTTLDVSVDPASAAENLSLARSLIKDVRRARHHVFAAMELSYLHYPETNQVAHWPTLYYSNAIAERLDVGVEVLDEPPVVGSVFEGSTFTLEPSAQLALAALASVRDNEPRLSA